MDRRQLLKASEASATQGFVVTKLLADGRVEGGEEACLAASVSCDPKAAQEKSTEAPQCLTHVSACFLVKGYSALS